MQDSKQRILTLLKINGGLTTNELSDMLGISATAVRRHLKALESQELVCHRSEQRGIGRPSFVYQLAKDASNGFVQSYAAFARSVLKELEELEPGQNGHEGPLDLFDRRQKKRHEQYIEQTDGNTLSERVAAIAQLMENEGRLTTWHKLDDERYILREHNCPFRPLAEKSDYPCRCEASLFQETLQAEVKRVGHILDGDIACVYEIGRNGNGRRRETSEN